MTRSSARRIEHIDPPQESSSVEPPPPSNASLEVIVNSDDSTTTDSDATTLGNRVFSSLEDIEGQRHDLEYNLTHQERMMMVYERELHRLNKAINMFNDIPEIEATIEAAKKDVEKAKAQLQISKQVLQKLESDRDQLEKDRQANTLNRQKADIFAGGLRTGRGRCDELKRTIESLKHTEQRMYKRQKKELNTKCGICLKPVKGLPVSLIHADFILKTDKMNEAKMCMDVNSFCAGCHDDIIRNRRPLDETDKCPHCRGEVMLNPQNLLQ